MMMMMMIILWSGPNLMDHYKSTSLSGTGDFADAPAESSGGIRGFLGKLFGRKSSTPAAAPA